MKHALWAACAVAVVATFAFAPARAGSPHDFLRDAIRGDNSEIMLGRIGEHRAATPAARSFAQMLVDDHGRAKSEALRLAVRLHVRPPRGPEKEALKERGRLRRLSGWEFDREFAQYMVKDHQKDIAKFQREANSGRGATSTLARRELPTLHKHLDVALSLDQHMARYTQGKP